MNLLGLIITFVYAQKYFSFAKVYEESIIQLLVECNAYQDQVHFKNRTVHACEKEDPDEDYSYYITPMITQYTKREFLCILFFKNDDVQLDFKLLFSHAKFDIDAVS